MKRIAGFLSALLLMATNVCAEEIQLTDYSFTVAKRMLDKYSYVAASDEYEYNREYYINNELYEAGTWIYDKVESNILKPNGTLLFNSEDYSVLYGADDFHVAFPQCIYDNCFAVLNTIYPYKKEQVIQKDARYFTYEGYMIKQSLDEKGNFIQPPLNGKPEKEKFKDLKFNHDTSESESERVDRSYTFKEKEINGTKYYALFKELNEGETAADFAPTEQPTEKYAEYISQMAESGLLFNNERCFYKRGITKLDFGIVLGRAYCNATGYNIDSFTSDTKFVDVNHPYCLLLADNDILTSDNELYINEKEISKQTVSDALDKTAEKCGVLPEWNGIKVIKPSSAPCSRELAYVETFRLYDLIKQHNAPNYTKFQPSLVLDSDSEAEPMHYETVEFNDTDAVSSETEETTIDTVEEITGFSLGNDADTIENSTSNEIQQNAEDDTSPKFNNAYKAAIAIAAVSIVGLLFGIKKIKR